MSAGFYISSDYAGVNGGDYSFYFGYEETIKSGDDEEWCFVAKKNGVMTDKIPQSKLNVSRGADMSEYLLAGISLWLDSDSSR